MKQIETLHLIRARCVELLEQAKLRTPGAWRVLDKDDECPGIEAGKISIVIWGGEDDEAGVRTGLSDATYIANASVAFEAALESTVAAIDAYFALFEISLKPCNGGSCCVATESDEKLAAAMIFGSSIITAWKHLLL